MLQSAVCPAVFQCLLELCVGYCLGCACYFAVQPLLQQAHTGLWLLFAPKALPPATTAGVHASKTGIARRS